MKTIIASCLALVFVSHAFSQTPAKGTIGIKPYPFLTSDRDGHYSITAQIETANLYETYNPVFERNGYCWEGHITQILEKVDKELLTHIRFDAEAGAFYASADSKNTQQTFIDIPAQFLAILTDWRNILKKLIEVG